MIKQNLTVKLALGGVFIALIYVTTVFFQIPVPPGVWNIGDTFIFVCSFFMGPAVAGIAGGLGSALADISSPYAVYAPFTLIIKGLEGLLAGYFVMMFLKGGLRLLSPWKLVFAFLLAALIMPTGYFLADTYLYGQGTALTQLIPNLIQMVCSLAGGTVITIGLSRTPGLRKLM